MEKNLHCVSNFGIVLEVLFHSIMWRGTEIGGEVSVIEVLPSEVAEKGGAVTIEESILLVPVVFVNMLE